MARVVPVVDATTPDDYAARIDRIKPFTTRLHVDISDGVFTETKTIGPSQVYGIDGAELDLHLMVDRPSANIETIISLAPSLVFCHFEASEDLASVFSQLKACDIRVGIAIKPDTTIAQIADILPNVDALLIYTGSSLGRNSSPETDEFQMGQLDKIAAARAIHADLEIAVDGHIDQSSAKLAIDSGADVLNVGSFIQNSDDPELAYEALRAIAEGL